MAGDAHKRATSVDIKIRNLIKWQLLQLIQTESFHENHMLLITVYLKKILCMFVHGKVQVFQLSRLQSKR